MAINENEAYQRVVENALKKIREQLIDVDTSKASLSVLYNRLMDTDNEIYNYVSMVENKEFHELVRSLTALLTEATEKQPSPSRLISLCEKTDRYFDDFFNTFDEKNLAYISTGGLIDNVTALQFKETLTSVKENIDYWARLKEGKYSLQPSHHAIPNQEKSNDILSFALTAGVAGLVAGLVVATVVILLTAPPLGVLPGIGLMALIASKAGISTAVALGIGAATSSLAGGLFGSFCGAAYAKLANSQFSFFYFNENKSKKQALPSYPLRYSGVDLDSSDEEEEFEKSTSRKQINLQNSA